MEKTELQVQGCEKIYNVLWVDDCPDNNKGIARRLMARRINIDFEKELEAVLQLVEINRYDLVITDMSQGHEYEVGLELIDALSERECQVPIIVFTSEENIQLYGKEAFELGAVEVICGYSLLYSNVLELLGIENH